MQIGLVVGVALIVFGLLWGTREEPWPPSPPRRPMRNRGDDECLARWYHEHGGV